MIAGFSFATWGTLNPLANHLWQSTLCAVLAGLLTLLLRGNRAQVRYSLWLIATVKFLVPFSIFMGMVSHLGVHSAPARLQSRLSIAALAITVPFDLPVVPPAGYKSTSKVALGNPLPSILLAAWLSGCIAVLCYWWIRWWRIAAAARAATPLQEGREFEALRRFRSKTGLGSRVNLVPSPTLQEPGVVGIWRPVMLLPLGISDHLADDQLEAIIGHEVCHARRRDNLALAIRMAVEAAFWFYPLVWWMGARLIEEQERACDEDVLRLGCKPQVYAESILRVCQFYLELPPVCVAGVTGSNLKRRMERIMNHRVPKQLGLGRKILIGVVGTALLAVLMAASIPFRDDFAGKLEPGWQWIDPQGDSTMSLDARPGFLRITVTGRHDLWPANRDYSAPRLMRGVQGDFTVETKIDGPERWCGGLLIWKDTNNYVRLERGIHFRNELLFEGANNGEFLPLAREYAAGDPTWLRLERRGSTVTASYSIDGVEWLPLKRLWRLFAFKKQPPQVEDGRSMLAEEDLEFEPGRSSTLFTSSGALLVGVSGLVPAVAPPVGVKQTVTDYDYLTITTP